MPNSLRRASLHYATAVFCRGIETSCLFRDSQPYDKYEEEEQFCLMLSRPFCFQVSYHIHKHNACMHVNNSASHKLCEDKLQWNMAPEDQSTTTELTCCLICNTP